VDFFLALHDAAIAALQAAHEAPLCKA